MKIRIGLCCACLWLWLVLPVFAAMPLSLRDMADILPEWPVTSIDTGGKLIFSDSPEMVEREGILYQDRIRGNVRLFFHHVNAMPDGKRVLVMLQNKGKASAWVEMLHAGVSGPDTDYLRAGRAVQADYFKETRPQRFEIQPGKSLRLPPAPQIPTIAANTILTGMVDFRSDQEVQLTVALAPVQTEPAAFLAQAAVLPPGKPYLRGTFPHADRVIAGSRPYNPASDGAVSVTLGDGEIDTFLLGEDATNGRSVRNDGNFGLLYRITLPTAGKGKIRCYLNPRGGAYAGWVTARTKQGEKLVGTPSKGLVFGHFSLADFELIAEFVAGDTLQVNLSPPGGSNLPIRLMLVPAP